MLTTANLTTTDRSKNIMVIMMKMKTNDETSGTVSNNGATCGVLKYLPYIQVSILRFEYLLNKQ